MDTARREPGASDEGAGGRPARPGRSHRRAPWIFGTIALVATALALGWRYGPMAEWVQPEELQRGLAAFRASPWRIPVVWGVFVVGGLLVVPINLLFLAVGFAFPFLEAVALSLSGGLLSGLVLHALGRRLDLQALLARAPRRLRRALEDGIERAGILELVVLRVLPLGPYTTMNLLWGAAGVGRRALLLASAIGLAPGILLTAMIGSGVRADMGPRALVLLVVGCLGLLGLALVGLRRTGR